MERIKEAWNYLKTRELAWSDLMAVLPLLPGTCLALVGISALYAPELLSAMLATFCIVLGISLVCAAWRVAQLFGKIKKLSNDFEARVYVQGFNIRGNGSEFEHAGAQPNEQKKIVYH